MQANTADQAPPTYVNVPGQLFQHSHTCACGHKWWHQAPYPMTPEVNDKIHTCPKCGQKQYRIDMQCVEIIGGTLLFVLMGFILYRTHI